MSREENSTDQADSQMDDQTRDLAIAMVRNAARNLMMARYALGQSQGRAETERVVSKAIRRICPGLMPRHEVDALVSLQLQSVLENAERSDEADWELSVARVHPFSQ